MLLRPVLDDVDLRRPGTLVGLTNRLCHAGTAAHGGLETSLLYRGSEGRAVTSDTAPLVSLAQTPEIIDRFARRQRGGRHDRCACGSCRFGHTRPGRSAGCGVPHRCGPVQPLRGRPTKRYTCVLSCGGRVGRGGILMCSIRGWLAHDAFMSLRQLAWRATVATSLFFVGCGSLPIFEEAATSHTGPAGASSLSIPVPPGVGGADLLVAILGIQSNPNTSGPEGWTVVPGFPGFNGAICQADGGGNACQLTVYYRIADGSETTASFSWGVIRQAAGAVLRFSNVDTNAPIGVARPSRGTSDAPTAPIITTTRDGSRVLRIVVCELDQAAISLRGSLALTDEPSSARLNLMSFPDALTDPTNGCGPPLSACDATVRAVGLAVADTRHATAKGSGPVSWRLAGGDQWLTASIEIKRAPRQ